MLLTVVAVVDVAVVPDGGPGEVPEVDHVKELCEIWLAVELHKILGNNCSDRKYFTFLSVWNKLQLHLKVLGVTFSDTQVLTI